MSQPTIGMGGHRKAHVGIQVTSSNVKVVMGNKETIIYRAIAINIFSV